jgi:hypothetical protein
LNHALDEKTAWEQVIPRSWDLTQWTSVSHVTLAQASTACVPQDFSPNRFGLTDDNTVAILQDLIRRKSGVWPACDNALTASFELPREAISFGGETTKKGKCDNIGCSFKIDRFDLLMNDADSPTWGSNRSEVDTSYWWNKLSFMTVPIPLNVDNDDIDLQDSYPQREMKNTKRLQIRKDAVAARCNATGRGTAGGR